MDLEEYLIEIDMPTSEFAKVIGCSCVHMYSIVSKKRKCSYSLAFQISAATGGKVTLEELAMKKTRRIRKDRRKDREVKI